MSPKQALVFGASGISGWAIARECLKYPSETTFDRVVALSDRELKFSEFLLPDQYLSRLGVHSGIDLSNNSDITLDKFASIEGIESTTHVYYTAYKHGSDHEALKINTTLLETALKLVTTACPRLEFFTLQTGAKTYGFEFFGRPGMPWSTPHTENEPRLPEPYGSKIFYYPQFDRLAATAQSQKWKFCDIRPYIISGFTPRTNGMGWAQVLGLFLSMYKDLEGEGSEVVFPGNQHMWEVVKWSDSAQDIVARFHIHASLNPGESSGKSFNIVDEAEGVTWKDTWPQLCAYFGLKGVGPDADSSKPKGIAWLMAHQDKWDDWTAKHNLKDPEVMRKSGWMILAAIPEFLPMDRTLDLGEARRIGFEETEPTLNGFFTAWDRMKEGGVIPQ